VALSLKVLALCQGPGRPVMRVRAQVLRCERIMDCFFDVGARFIGLAE
jgi:hypothetical protein